MKVKSNKFRKEGSGRKAGCEEGGQPEIEMGIGLANRLKGY